MNYIDSVKEKVFKYIEDNAMFKEGCKVVLGVSGGADSVCLLRLLLMYREINPITITVVHINHMIREDAAEDASFVRKLCEKYGLESVIIEADVRKMAEEKGLSEEDAGRRVRYNAFNKVLEKTGSDVIAVAHNKNDRAETMLFNLFRGTGLKGVASIKPVRDNIVRPILCLTREEIESFLLENGQMFRTDSTNFTNDYARNRIRHNIIPAAEECVSKNVVEHLYSTSEMLSDMLDLLSEKLVDLKKKAVTKKLDQSGNLCGYILDAEIVGQAPKAVKTNLLYELINSLTPNLRDISGVHVKYLEDLLEREKNRSINLPFGIIAVRNYGKVNLYISEKENEAFFKNETYAMSYEICESENEADFYKKSCDIAQNDFTKWFDYDRIDECPNLRTRKPGDYLLIEDGEGGLVHKSVKDFMIGAKIPKQIRNYIPCVAVKDHVLWVVGYRMSAGVKVGPETKRILKVSVTRES